MISIGWSNGQWPICPGIRLNMGVAMKPVILIICLLLLIFSQQTNARSKPEEYTQSMIDKYSQKTLLKNWAFCVCLAKVSKDTSTREDANTTASAYLEFGRQSIETYDALRTLAEQYANRKY